MKQIWLARKYKSVIKIYQLNFHHFNMPVSVSRRPQEDSMTTTRACLTRWRLTIQTIENTDLKWKSKIRIENSNSIEYNMILVVCSLLGESCWDLWGKWVLSAFSQTTYFHVDYYSMINFPRRLHPRLWDCERALVWGRLWGLQYFAKKKTKLVSSLIP